MGSSYLVSSFSRRIDPLTQFLVVIDAAHHEIHSGDSFVVTDTDASVDNATPKYWRITTPNSVKWAHFIVSIWANDAGLAEFFESPTEDDPVVAGTAITAYNRNRNSAITATTAIKYDPVFTADGTRLDHALIGSSSINPILSSGGSGSTRYEFILGQNKTYTVKFTPDGDGVAVWIIFDWYESE